jgi:hypothetical protein
MTHIGSHPVQSPPPPPVSVHVPATQLWLPGQTRKVGAHAPWPSQARSATVVAFAQVGGPPHLRPDRRGAQPDPSALQAPVRHSPVHDESAQQMPARQVRPVRQGAAGRQGSPGPPLGAASHPRPRQICPVGQGLVVVTQVPATLQVLLLSAAIERHALPQSVPAARGRQPDPSALQAPVRQRPLQLSAAQQMPWTQVRPVMHSLVAAQDCPGPLSGGGGSWQPAALATQICPGGHGAVRVTHEPAVQVFLVRLDAFTQVLPQSVPSGLGWQPSPSVRHRPVEQALPLQEVAVQHRPEMQVRPLWHCPLLPPQGWPGPRATGSHPFVLGLQTWPAPQLTGAHFQLVAAEQIWQPPAHTESQQWPWAQAPDWQSPLATQGPPRSCWAAAQRFFWQTSPGPQALALVWQAPAASHVAVTSAPSSRQAAAPQVAPLASRWHRPAPSQPLPHRSSLHVPVGSTPPAGTMAQAPSDPGSAHDWHMPSQAVAQQRPCAQIPGPPHSSLRAHVAPIGRLPHDPFRHWAPGAHCRGVTQKVTQRLSRQPRNGAHDRAGGTVQVPPLQMPAPVLLFEPGSQPASRQMAPSA